MSASPRYVSLPEPHLLRITVGNVMCEYRLEVWQASSTHRVCELTRVDNGEVYKIVIAPHRHPKCANWSCDCHASKYRGGQCKHILAIKAGLRSVGVKV